MSPPRKRTAIIATEIAEFATRALSSLSDTAKAAAMAAYMKTDMPFYGVQKPGRVGIARQIKKRFPIPDWQTYETVVLALWQRPYREEKYLAIQVAMGAPEFVEPRSMALYERIIREGARALRRKGYDI